ncbi:2-phospho-L-lactate guanylyltransferase [Methermicoccus shengliensis]|uniref:2-phospho-L-lactate guanylyltransferase n=1 Tax=Methermicoccus shengliensis TaxID=660064 RepID=A0A832RYD3_9EURY|nr:2-phospho-L-lactate guanylyltransferase [Methermicoccus shengliensis]KUK04507.1 MAG: 2-phospho-L-lactate guanylyltransferase [Euryarchaeota archaeon 55_53]KUK30591.1 MAG: 2-phospho-L-lactate guanylyltransferase [Methanosarcinales archeaon 56_1174]MDI3488555.1 2-phospho-L-lactate/phosphoenolpyruvate guanylyltransferase [Methanosarcinales archaeon]MDN5295414.1 2-phospho-L-lactate/phosphoenolpyruvate guanylyltransferase [Methanosarcinales archaeon]HIH70182.1 2-phospho-L-lactate guanylyltransfe
MRALVPFKVEDAKSRLAEVLSPSEREHLAMLMLKSVLEQLVCSSVDVVEVASTSMGFESPVEGVGWIYAPHPLDEVVNTYLEKVAEHMPGEQVIVVMADLPLITSRNIDEMCSSSADVVIAPGRAGGTNVLRVSRPERFEVRYHNLSFLTHEQLARKRGLSVEVYDSFYTSVDIDEPQDLVELLIHDRGEVRAYLEEIGLYLEPMGAKVELRRK